MNEKLLACIIIFIGITLVLLSFNVTVDYQLNNLEPKNTELTDLYPSI